MTPGGNIKFSLAPSSLAVRCRAPPPTLVPEAPADGRRGDSSAVPGGQPRLPGSEEDSLLLPHGKATAAQGHGPPGRELHGKLAGKGLVEWEPRRRSPGSRFPAVLRGRGADTPAPAESRYTSRAPGEAAHPAPRSYVGSAGVAGGNLVLPRTCRCQSPGKQQPRNQTLQKKPSAEHGWR